ncbi:hypothetical protein BDY24DRAFT_437168 [Mrakia frigida]|uniref:zinc finger MYND domain-containing protein n=1 Tax=Mrakia frigida TaxID=29902 RepID=UPI003FCBFBCB
MSKVLYWSICCSPPDLTISFASPAVQRDATRLLDRFSLHYDTIKVVIKHCPESAKEYDLSEDMDFFAKRMAPFLLGSNKAGWVSGSNTISFWDCSGKQSKTPCVEVGERKDFLRCTRCLSVIYCSKAHQKWDWKHGGHKAICLVPTW